MPPHEGLALSAAAESADTNLGPFLEVGSYCGKSACYLGPIARRSDTVLFCVDHHRGSEENQVGWEASRSFGIGCSPLRYVTVVFVH